MIICKTLHWNWTEIVLRDALKNIKIRWKICSPCANNRIINVCILIEKGMVTIWYIYIKIYLELRRVWRYQRGNQNPHIEEEQTTQWPKEKVQKDNHRSTKHTYKTKDWVTQPTLKTGVNSGSPEGRVNSSYSTSYFVLI